MANPGNPRSSGGIGVWPLVIGAAAVILVVVLFLMGGPVKEPVPLPDSPAAHGTAGQPSGVTGELSPHPGAPAGAEAPAGSPTIAPNPDLAPGTGVDTTRGN